MENLCVDFSRFNLKVESQTKTNRTKMRHHESKELYQVSSLDLIKKVVYIEL